MAWWITLLVVVQIVCALSIIILVLLQHGKGADMGASFGGGASGSLFGATGSANFLSRSTAVCAATFFACTLVLALLSHGRAGQPRESSSVLDRPAAASAPASGAESGAIPAIPSAIPPAATTAIPAPSVPASQAAPASAASAAK